MKKLIVFLLAALLCMSLAACDMSSLEGLLDDPNKDSGNADDDLGGLQSTVKFEPYTIEYKDMGDGTCHVTGIKITRASHANIKDSVNIEHSFEVDDPNLIYGTVNGGDISGVTVIMPDGTTGTIPGNVIITQAGNKDIDIVIPETNPDGLRVTGIDFGGFACVVPEQFGPQASYRIFANFKGSDFDRAKFMSYYKDDGNAMYFLDESITDEDLINLSDFMLNELMLDYDDFRIIYEEIEKEVPNIALGVRSITLPDGIEYISDYAFAWCYDLKEFNAPDGLEYNNNVLIGSQFYQ